MTKAQQVEQVGKEFEAIIDRARHEYEISYLELVGLLHFIAAEVTQEGLRELDGGGE